MHRILPSLFLTALTACQIDGVKPGSQIGSETGGCQVQSTESLADTSVAPEGFTMSPDAVAELSLGDFSGSLERTGGDSLAMTLSVTADGEPVREVMDTNDGTEIFCSDLIALPVLITLSAEGALDEQVEANVRLSQEDSISFFVQLDDADVQGSAEPDLLVAEDLNRLWLNVFGSLDSDGAWTGDVEWVGEEIEDSTSDDAMVSATSDVYGSFSLAAD